ncbi:MAG TPA: right-handed parallel beta-helix repeat-containing protein [Lacunisphaera sp.]|nr:right-handed parallel beta-helix repeat-containing protein [Lacunisphaera sp.]
MDFVGGSDTNNGTSTATPWKHCPGDNNATGVANTVTPAPGDTINFKGGVRYEGKITLLSGGTSGARITYQGQPAGWGTGKAIIDGASPVTMTVCTGNGTGAGQVPNANFASIYRGTMPAGADWLIPVMENDAALDLTSTAVGNPIPFFYADTEYFNTLSAGITAVSCTDPARFNQTDPAYWVGARIVVHVAGNSAADAEITSFDPATDTVTYANVGTPLVDANWDNKFHYVVVNSPRLIAAPGQYAVDTNNGIIYVWPRSDPTKITASTRNFAFHTNGNNYVTIDGFVVTGHYSAGFALGRSITGTNSSGTNGVIIQNCDIKNAATGGGSESSGTVYLRGAGAAQNAIQNCTFSYIHGRGPFVQGSNVAVKGCTITFIDATCIYTQNFSSEQNTDGEISGNYIDNCRGVHQNGITVYGSAGVPASRWVVKNNVVKNFTQRYGPGGITAQNYNDLEISNNLIEADQGLPIDGPTAGCNYQRFFNNTIVVPRTHLSTAGNAGVIRIFNLSLSTVTDVRNNICAGLTISDLGSSSPVTAAVWARVTHTNNIYTSFAGGQDAAHGFTLHPTESVSSSAALFADPANGDWRLKSTALEAVDKGADLSGFFATDLSGNSRVSAGLAWDIGAFESGFTGTPIFQPPTGAAVNILVH